MISHNGSLRLIAESEKAAVYHGSMRDASFWVDMLAVDPPWRQGNLSYWSHQAGVEQQWGEFVADLEAHFSCDVVYLKVGVPESAEWLSILRQHRFLTRCWQTTYCGGHNCQIVASRYDRYSGQRPKESRASTDAVAEWARKRGVLSVADPCVGLGKMLAKFLSRDMDVVGVELVESRAMQAAQRLCRA